MPRLVLLACLALAGCGADGAPKAPVQKAPVQTGLTISGDAQIGIVSR
jgi:hypothetical protein